MIAISSQLGTWPGYPRLGILSCRNQLINGLIKACCRWWWQAAQADGPAQQVALPLQTQRPQNLEIKPLRAARCGGKIDIGQRKLIWIWSHRLIDWLRLQVWTWTP